MTNPTLTQIARGSYEAQPDAHRLPMWHALLPGEREAHIKRTARTIQALIANISEDMVKAGAKKDAEFEFTDGPIIARAIFTAMLSTLLKGDEA